MRVGLTGGIGSGKSTASARFAEHGAVIVDSDALAREVVAIGTPGLAAVVDRFGPRALRPDGSLDRGWLGGVVFGDPQALSALNAIVHPLVRERGAQVEAAAAGAVVISDIPLLVENGLQDGFDEVIVVVAPMSLRLARLAVRGVPEEVARARIAQQATDEERQAVATVVLDNGGSVAELWAQVDEVWAGWADLASG